MINYSMSTDVCGVDKMLRIDCFPEISPGIETACAERGCCYDPNDHPSSDGSPWCFYPSNYSSYEVAALKKTNYGLRGILQMTKAHQERIENEIPLLTLDVYFETSSRLRFSITNSQKSRYEVPIETPKINKAAENLLYTVDCVRERFGIVIRNKHTGSPVFNSTIGPLLYADQFLQISTLLPSTWLYGLGERHSNSLLDIKWNRLVFWARDQQPMVGENLYGSHPFLLGIENNGYSFGIFLLNSNALEVFLQPAPAITWRTIGGILDFYVFIGNSPEDVVQQYVQVIGKPSLPPYWGLGFHICRWGYTSANDTWSYVNRTRNALIPQDVQWNDLDYTSNFLDFTYNKTTFSNLPNMVQDLHANDQKYVMIIDPGISNQQEPGTYPPYDEGLASGIFVRQPNSNKPIEGIVWPGKTVFPDFFNPKTKDYWKAQLKAYRCKIPFDGVWIDMNEPSNFATGSTTNCPDNNLENPPYVPKVSGYKLIDKTLCMSARHYNYSHYDVHNLYGLFEMKATYKALLETRRTRPFIISRSTYPSSGRYGGHWTGDISSTWANLKQSIVGITNFNLFGVPLIGADICGFAGLTTEELCIRWTQLGAFYPFSRNHNTIGTRGQSPVDFSNATQSIMRNALFERYKFLPYLYTLFYRAHVNGTTVARGLYFEFPNDKWSHVNDEQFLWGHALMITPVLVSKASSIIGYFPPGIWFDIYHDFGHLINSTSYFRKLYSPLELIPLHIRGGYIIPAQFPALNTIKSRRNPFILYVALNSSQQAFGELYWDDGDSLNSMEKDIYSLIQFISDDNCLRSQIIHLGYPFFAKLSKIHVFGLPHAPTQVTNNDEDLQFHILHNNVLEISAAISLQTEFCIKWN